VDFSKAFDTIEHNFIGSVLNYFNFGSDMKNMVKVILTNKEGQIIMENDYSDLFRIERGTPQGDRESPYIFILCMEVLLLG
jgi:Reverse transcriptase (RNA-dependent DNA polymerase)